MTITMERRLRGKQKSGETEKEKDEEGEL